MQINHAQFKALFAGLDWRRVRAVEAKAPEAVERAVQGFGRMTQLALSRYIAHGSLVQTCHAEHC
jgi:hypothetical protein